MGAGKNAQADDIHILLDGRTDDLFRRSSIPCKSPRILRLVKTERSPWLLDHDHLILALQPRL
jgi:hypothetical protein